MKAVSPQVKFAAEERQILDWWQKKQIFEKSNLRRRGSKVYTFYDGPPFANGLPHYGHLLANTVKDTVPRYWNMRGYDVERRFGWDCHGFPVECEIEKRDNLKGRPDILAMGVANFNEACRASVQHYTEQWQHTITRLGRWVDWNNQYKTMDLPFMESVWWVLKQLHNKGLFYQGYKVVPYSPRLSAVLSNFEANLNYKDVQDPAITVKFKLQDEEQAFILAWTTTPWTLIANLALVVGPEIPYVKIRHHESKEIYYLAEARLDAIFPSKKGTADSYEILERLSADKLVGRAYAPLFPYYKGHAGAFVVLADGYVTTSEGTGVVHQAPAYGEDDFRVCRQHNIELVDPLDTEACYTAEIPELKGQFVKDADRQIIRMLKDKGLLLKQETIVHSYPHCERTEGPLIYRAIPAWYVRVEEFKDRLVANNKTIRWVPEHLRDGRMGHWLENARDWAISRNRFWGTPLPVWVSEQDPNHFEVIGSIKELEEKSGFKATDLHKHFIDEVTWTCKKTGATMRRVPEVFDCWFESGAMPYAQNHYPFENEKSFHEKFPADFIAEGLDQTRGWFYTLSVLSEALFGKPAFKNVVVNGLVLAADGKKMSKRLGNYTPPVDLIEKFGADSVRLYMLNSPILRAEPLRFSDEGVRDTTRAVLLPLWNAFSFLTTYGEADGWQPRKSLIVGEAAKSNHELDRWIVSRLQSLKQRVHNQMEQYRLYHVVPEVLAFVDELTNWYIRLSRRRFWGEASTDGAPQSTGSDEAYATLYYVLGEFSKVFAPFAPFISERIYQGLCASFSDVPESVHLCDMPLPQEELIDSSLEERMSLVRRVTNLGRSLRAKHKIRTRQVLPSMLVITRKPDDAQYIQQSTDVLLEELNLKHVAFSSEEAKYVRLSVKPNLRTLGKRFGKRLGELRQHLQQLNQSHDDVSNLLAELEGNGSVNLLGESLNEDDFLIERGPKDHRMIATEAGVTVLLDTTLTPELIKEGLAREVVNRIQKLRKESALDVSDRIRVAMETDKELSLVVDEHKDYIQAETLALELIADQAANEKFSEAFDIEGHQGKIGITVLS